MPTVNCPKPGCGWSIDPVTVPAGQVVVCPTCGQRFKLASSTPAPPGSGSGFGRTMFAIVGVAMLFAVLTGAVVAVVMTRKNTSGVQQHGTSATDIRDESRNFAFTPPGGDWVTDLDLRTALGMNVTALHRTTAPEAWAAMSVKDYGGRVPLESELRSQMVATLGRVFLNLPAEPPLEPTTWAGQPAVIWRFRGEHQITGTVCGGEAVAMTLKGVGYWFYGWASERDFDPADLQQVRDRFRLLGSRDDWKPTVGSEVTFRSQAGGYRLTSYEKIWELVPKPDEGVEIELRGQLKGRGQRSLPSRAEIRVWRQADTGDPMSVADSLVRKEFTRDPAVFGPIVFVEQTEPPFGDTPPGPDSPPATQVNRLNVTSGSEDTGKTRKLVVYAAIKVGSDVVVAAGSCPWDEREVWERRLVKLIGSLR